MNPEHASRPRVGVPYRTRKEELTSQREAYQKYLGAVCIAGGIPVEISLGWSPDRLEKAAQSVDAIILPGSPADLEPSRFHAARHPQAAEADADRERTDFALLDHAIKNQKPVLAICYGIQSLNVYLGGSLVQTLRAKSRLRFSTTGPSTKVPSRTMPRSSRPVRAWRNSPAAPKRTSTARTINRSWGRERI